MADAGEAMKKEREPITLVCGIVLLIAIILVGAVYVNNEFIQKHDETVEYGDSITVDYVGSLYQYYDKNGETLIPVIFDTSIESVGTNSDNVFTGSFNKTEYKPMTITAGNDSNVLKAFSAAVVGHKVGETVEVTIPAKDAYPAANNNKAVAMAAIPFSNGFSMTLDEFNKYYGQSLCKDAGLYNFEYRNLPITATVMGSNVSVLYNDCDAKCVYDGPLGKVNMAISGSTFTLSGIEGKKTGNNVTVDATTVEEIEMLCIDAIPVSTMNILGYDATNIIYNTSGYDSVKKADSTIFNMDLYFKITIVSKS